jgi:iduronate 2-sulfatase
VADLGRNKIRPWKAPLCWFAIPSMLAACVADSPQQALSQRPNILLLCVDDLRPELACFGVDYIHSPNMDQLAATGRSFARHYVQAPTCGASRYALLMGRYGAAGNDALFRRARELNPSSKRSLPEHFRQHGYLTVAVGKVSHHPGGLGGADWNDPEQVEMPGAWLRSLLPAGPWQHPRGAMHGLAHGEIRIQAQNMAVLQDVEGEDTAYPDGWITAEALRQLDQLQRERQGQPFFLAVGWLRPHLPFGAPRKYLQHYLQRSLPPIPHPEVPAGVSTWHGSGEFMKYQRWGKDPRTDPQFADQVRRHYAACVSYVDEQVGRVLQKLRQLNLVEQTVVVLWGDHGWHLGEHGVWGKHTLFEESLRSPLIVRTPALAEPGQSSTAIVETVDLFPTLCELSDLPVPVGLSGQSLVAQLNNPQAQGRPAVAYTGRAESLRTDRYRLTVHRRDGEATRFELYDHCGAGEVHNLAAERPEIVQSLLQQLSQRLHH